MDFAHVKGQLTMAQVLDQLGLSARWRGQGPQRRGVCPLHRGDGRGRTFSVNGVGGCAARHPKGTRERSLGTRA